MFSMVWRAARHASISSDAMKMLPSSSMSILQPVSAVIFWMTFAAGADDLADLVGIDLHLDHLRCALCKLLARFGQSA